MEFLPTDGEVLALLRKTGALRDGHFGWPASGLHTNRHIETALVMRSYANARVLCVGLSRLLRGTTEFRALIPELSIVAATPAGLPVACCLAEALRVKQVYWAEKERGGALRFRQYMEPKRGDKVVLVDDILRSGLLLQEARTLLEGYGAEVLALAVLLHQPGPYTHDFSPLPLYYLAKIEAEYYPDSESCPLCRRGVPVQCIGVEPADRGPALPCRAAAN